MPVQIQLRRGTAAAWLSADPILAEGEIGTETDTGKWKVGDGVTHWSSLPYAYGADGNAVLYGSVAPTTEGANGNFYIDTSTNYLYGPKVAGVWPAGTSLVGPAGPAGASVPIGAIVMWSGTIASIPTPQWQLCDGSANSPGPDLRDKFVVGARQDSGGVAKTNIEGTLKQSATATGASIADHSALSHAGGSVADHTGLTHDGSVAAHPDLTHAALSHPAITVTHADHSVPSASHTHASGADVSVPSQAVASALASRPSFAHSHASGLGSRPSLAVPSGAIASGADISVPSAIIPSQAIASGVDVSVPSGTIASTAGVSTPSQAIASGVDISAPGLSFTTLAGSRASYNSRTGVTLAGTVTASVVTTGGLQLTHFSSNLSANAPSVASDTNVTAASHSHATFAASRPSFAVVSAANASAPSGSVASALASRPSLAVASAADPSGIGSRPSLAVPSQSIASGVDVSLPSLSDGGIASGVDVSVPTGAVASGLGSRPSLTGAQAAITLTHADHSLASLSHQDIGSHLGSIYGTHAFTPPAGHGTAGTLTHSFTQPSAHTVSSHSTVAIVPAYFALAYIQRMS
jgi:hypothetical protein